jgi:hypothetical protein
MEPSSTALTPADVSLKAPLGKLIGVHGFGGVYRANLATGLRLCEALSAGIVGGEKSVSPGFYFGRNRKRLVITTFCCRTV